MIDGGTESPGNTTPCLDEDSDLAIGSGGMKPPARSPSVEDSMWARQTPPRLDGRIDFKHKPYGDGTYKLGSVTTSGPEQL